MSPIHYPNDEPAADPNVLFDPADVMARFNGDGELAQYITDLYLKEMPSRLVELTEAVSHRRMDRIRALAHAINGASATLAGHAMVRVAREMEMASVRSDHARLDVLVVEVNKQFVALRKLLVRETWLGRGDVPSGDI